MNSAALNTESQPMTFTPGREYMLPKVEISGLVGLARITASQHRKRLAQEAQFLADATARRFRFGGKKEAAGAAVAVMVEGVMEIECGLVIRKMLLRTSMFADGAGKSRAVA